MFFWWDHEKTVYRIRTTSCSYSMNVCNFSTKWIMALDSTRAQNITRSTVKQNETLRINHNNDEKGKKKDIFSHIIIYPHSWSYWYIVYTFIPVNYTKSPMKKHSYCHVPPEKKIAVNDNSHKKRTNNKERKKDKRKRIQVSEKDRASVFQKNGIPFSHVLFTFQKSNKSWPWGYYSHPHPQALKQLALDLYPLLPKVNLKIKETKT